jgi:phenylalanyl-tRNA synthetase alpha chain
MLGFFGMEYSVPLDEQQRLLKGLEVRADTDASRIKRYLSMPDLSRTPGSPLCELVKRARSTPSLKNLDNIIIPEVVPASISFDLFDFAPDHPARSTSDTYYVDDKNILRTHDTVMWYYYLTLPEVKERVARGEDVGTVCYGKVYRKDEIDNRHMNVFHQFGGWLLQPDTKGIMPIDELKRVLSEVVEALFGAGAEYRFLDDVFPYTDPSLQVEVKVGGRWIEILGGGMPKKSVLKNFGVEGYNGWAFGFGLERLAIISMELPDIRLLWSQDPRVTRQLTLGQAFKEVSKYPAVVRDISFVVPSSFVPNNYFDLIRDTVGEELVEEVALLDTYRDPKKFGDGKISFTYRITYRSLERTLTNEEVDALHKKLEGATIAAYTAQIR